MSRLQELNEPGVKKAAKDYRLLKKYDVAVFRVGEMEVKKLVKRGTNLQYLSESEVFDAIHDEHLSTGNILIN